MTGDREGAAFSPRTLLLLVLGVGAIAWVAPMGRALWTDETLTVWVSGGDVGRTVDRALGYQQWPLYYLITWPFARSGGGSEMVLRIPSVFASVVTSALLWKLARRLLPASPEAGAVAVLSLMGTFFTLEAYDARPYALGMAFAVASTLQLLRLLERPSHGRAAGYGALAALIVWAHYLLAPMLLVHAVYVGVRLRRRSTALSASQLVTTIAAATLFLAPVAWHLVRLWSRRLDLANPGMSPLLVPVVVLNLVAIPALLVAVLTCRGKVSVERPTVEEHGGALVVAWLLVPWLVLWAISAFSTLDLVNARYLVTSTPAAGVAVAAGAAALRPRRPRRAFILALAAITAVAFGGFVHRSGDWRGAIQIARSITDADSVVLARVDLIEATHVEWLTDPGRRSYLLAPFSAYPLETEPVALPLFPDNEGAAEYLDALLRGPLAQVDRFVLIEDGDTYWPWLEERLAPFGWDRRVIRGTIKPHVVEFVRTA